MCWQEPGQDNFLVQSKGPSVVEIVELQVISKRVRLYIHPDDIIVTSTRVNVVRWL